MADSAGDGGFSDLMLLILSILRILSDLEIPRGIDTLTCVCLTFILILFMMILFKFYLNAKVKINLSSPI